jgi:putative heme-binding domain-containing protein
MVSNYSKGSSAALLAATCLALWVDLGAVLAEDQDIGKPKVVTPATGRWERLPKLLQDYVDRQDIAGGVILVLHKGKPVCFEAVGMADKETKTPMARDAIFRIASMSKPITSVAVMMLVEDGKIRLDDSLEKYLPEFKDMTVLVLTKGDNEKPYQLARADHAITIRNLLTHTSGITYRMSDLPHLGKLYAEAGISDGLVEKAGTVGDNVARLAKLPLIHQPGTAWEYGLSTDILGRVIEVVSGKSLGDFFRTRIFEPLRMQDTGFIVPKDKRSRFVALYTPGEKKTIRRIGEGAITVGSTIYSATYSTADDNRYQSGGAGLASTAADYGRFLQMMLKGGELDGKRLLKPETVDQMTHNQIGDLHGAFTIHGDGFGYGFGVVTGREKPASPAPKGSYSWGGIFNTFFWVDPKEQLVGIVMTQLHPFGHLTLWKDFQEKVYQNLTKSDGPVKEPSGKGKDVPQLPAQVSVSEVTIHGSMDCFKVKTPSATYIYGKKGAGFASILDKDGRDWISYRPDGKAKGEYRGLPKCGQPSKFFHCGYGYGQYKTDNIFVSKVTIHEPDRVRIESETLDKKSACTWDFYPTHATLTLLRIDASTFWFLYEGTPGGRLVADKDFVIRSDGQKSSLNEPWSQVVPWVCFGSGETPVGFVCVNNQKPEKGQTDSYVAWPFEKEKDGSYQDMTVFGFGRKGYKELVQHVPDLTGLPARFSIGFVEKADSAMAKALVEKLRKMPKESEGPAQTKADPNVLRQVAMKNLGKADQGRLLFDTNKAKCAVCHRVNGKGGEVGPDLSQIAGKFDRAHLIESILNPSAEILQGYQTSIIETKAGRTFTGIIKSESKKALTLMDAEGKPVTISLGDIESRSVSKVSLMPAALIDDMSPTEFTDLIAYLDTLRTGRQPTPGEDITGPLTLPEGFKVEVVANLLTGATAMEVTANGTIFICEQTGALRVFKDGKLLPDPFVKLTVDSTWERGLIGVTVAPDFPKTPQVFVCYISPKPYPHHVISRFTVVGDKAEPGSEKILFEGDDQTKLGGDVPAGHQGGAIHFGKDGKLYIAIGDQTAGKPAQELNSLLGRMLRINADGTIPDDNPFANKAKGKYRATWVLGMRNPFTFAVQPKTGRLFINDVGGKSEEINEGLAGANYGWPTVDHGPTTDPQFRSPIHYYPEACIAGGDFAPSDLNWPTEFRGQYFFGDFKHGWIKSIDPDKPELAHPFATGLRRPVDLRFAADGALYVLVRDAWVIDNLFKGDTGSLLRIMRTDK